MKQTVTYLRVALFMTVASLAADAQEVHLFRIVGPADTRILSVNANGTIVWTNSQPGATFTFQTATTVNGVTNWVDYVQMAGGVGVTSNKLFDPNPPAGMVFIPAGSFVLGATTNMGHEYYGDEVPQTVVTVSACYIDKFEVTKGQWEDVFNWATNHGYSFSNQNYYYVPEASNHPVHTVKWYDAAKWCNARSEKEGKLPAYYTDAAHSSVYRAGNLDITNGCVSWNAGYRLPTEAEWEKAARGGSSGHRFSWSDTDTIAHTRANYKSSTSYAYDDGPVEGFGYDPLFYHPGINQYTSPVGYFAANGYGLYDMTGNVKEWCWDTGGTYSGLPTTDPHGPPTFGGFRACKGGMWNEDAFDCRVARRYFYTPGSFDNSRGFRCVLPSN